MRSLVIGGAGFVGKYLIDELCLQNNEVYVTKLQNERFENEKSTVLDLDITNFDQICEVIEKTEPDVIYHLAAQSSVKLSWERPALTAKINIIGAINLFEAVRLKNKSIKIIVIGSSEEYGTIDYSKPVKEESITNPNNIYAITKLSQEQIAKTYVKAYGMNIVMTRSFNHIGAGQLPTFVVADFCSQVASIEAGIKEPVIYVGNLSALRDFTDVRDVVKAYTILAEKGANGEIYNVGSGKPVQIEEILKTILSLSKKEIKVEVDSSKFRPIDVPVISADIEKIKELGWTPTIELKTSLVDVLNYFREKNREN